MVQSFQDLREPKDYLSLKMTVSIDLSVLPAAFFVLQSRLVQAVFRWEVYFIESSRLNLFLEPSGQTDASHA